MIAHPLVDAFQTCIKLITFAKTVFFAIFASVLSRPMLGWYSCITFFVFFDYVFFVTAQKQMECKSQKMLINSNQTFLLGGGKMISVCLHFLLILYIASLSQSCHSTIVLTCLTLLALDQGLAINFARSRSL